eukprot:6454881-Amphidinium_carterae.2
MNRIEIKTSALKTINSYPLMSAFAVLFDRFERGRFHLASIHGLPDEPGAAREMSGSDLHLQVACTT